MSGDFLQNLVTRHLGLDPVLQPRPTSRFETSLEGVHAVNSGEYNGEDGESASLEINASVRAAPFPATQPENFTSSDENSGVDKSAQTPRGMSINPTVAADKVAPATQYIETQLANAVSPAIVTNVVKQAVTGNDTTDTRSDAGVVNRHYKQQPSPFTQHGDYSTPAVVHAEQNSSDALSSRSNKARERHVTHGASSTPSGLLVQQDNHGLESNPSKLPHQLNQLIKQFRAEVDAMNHRTDTTNDDTRPVHTDKTSHPVGEIPQGSSLSISDRALREQQAKPSNPEPVINVTIGRIEVRAVPQAKPPVVKQPQTQAKAMSLENYLRKRGGDKS